MVDSAYVMWLVGILYGVVEGLVASSEVILWSMDAPWGCGVCRGLGKCTPVTEGS